MKKYGLKFDTIKTEDYYLGGGFIGTEELQPNGQWDEFLPSEEIQNENEIETQNCTAFGIENCVNILMNKLFHEEKNYSERFIGIMANTDPYSGNSPHTVCESARKNGFIEEIELPFDESIKTPEDYFQPKPMEVKYIIKGQMWLRQYDFKHEWVWRDNPEIEEKIKLIKEALKRSPVGISVYAWDSDENGIYQKRGQDNHWVCCYGYRDDIKVWKIFDSYTNTYKLYSFDANISMAKLFWIKKKPLVKENWYIDLIKRLFSFIIIRR